MLVKGATAVFNIVSFQDIEELMIIYVICRTNVNGMTRVNTDIVLR